MSLPKEIRARLVEDFNIQRTGPAEVRDEHVITDGYTYSDLAVFTLQSMTDYVGYSESFSRLWDLTIMRATEKVFPPAFEISLDNGDITPVTGEVDIVSQGTVVEPTPEILEILEEGKPPFCSSCTSKGVRHKKECPLIANSTQ